MTADTKITVAIAGGSGYGGGELVRLLLDHPNVEIAQVTSERFAGKLVSKVHPNLRGATSLKFCALVDLAACDLLFLSLPHGHAMERIDYYRTIAPRIIDLSGDFRLDDPGLYAKWYGHDHTCPGLLESFVYGIPEIHRQRIADASLVTGAGCNATASILALLPVFRRGLARQAVIEVKAGSSEGGNSFSEARERRTQKLGAFSICSGLTVAALAVPATSTRSTRTTNTQPPHDGSRPKDQCLLWSRTGRGGGALAV